MEYIAPTTEEVWKFATEIAIPFSEIERAIKISDGSRFETDGEHTTSLALVACAVADRLGLDVGLTAQLAIVHDVVERFAGDTSVWASKKELSSKSQREAESLILIKREYDISFPWIGRMIERYERLEDEEARLVKSLDKVMPTIMHLLNDGEHSKREGITYEMHLEKVEDMQILINVHPVASQYHKDLMRVFDDRRDDLYPVSS
ncbi:MAG TPA: HD domain-containing protein [Candidatus Saccharimonadales bacterium]